MALLPISKADLPTAVSQVLDLAANLELDMVANPVPNPVNRKAMMRTSWKANSTKRKNNFEVESLFE